MYTRIMAVVLTVIVLLTVSLSAVCFVSLRNRQVDAKLEMLKSEAREIAWLAAQNSDSTLFITLPTNSISKVLSWKAGIVYSDYGAYILVVDRRGRVMDNVKTAYEENPDFIDSINGDELSSALLEVLGGNEISVRTTVNGNTTFTVGVPFVQDQIVLGAVLIQTPTQTVEGVEPSLIWQIAGIALLSMLVCGGVLLWYVRHALRPLRRLTSAARSLTRGDFTVQVTPNRSAHEIAELSDAFNLMAGKLGELEESRREFVANVSHELRSPITSIRGFVEGMEDGTIPPEEHPRYLAIVADETRRLSRLIGDLLALSRLERKDATLSLTAFDITELLRRCVIKRVTDLEQHHMDIVCDFPEHAVQVLADCDRIEQVAGNLLDNAIKFTPDGGQITLTVSELNDHCAVTVADNGCGISAEDKPHIFERFYTADRAHTSGKGTGLGLPICQRILEMHGEELTLLDTPQGAAFRYTLKLDHAEEAK